MALLKALAVALLVVQAANAATNDPKGYAGKGLFPFHVSIQKVVEKNKYEHVCSGALIKKNFVLTAASCLYNKLNNTDFVIKAGVLNIYEADTNDVQVVPVNKSSVQFHQNYKPNGSFYNEHDIAILQLTKNVTLNEAVNVIELPGSKANVNISLTATMIGYEFESSLIKNTLKFFQSYLIDNVACKDTLKQSRSEAVLYNSQFCASDLLDQNVYTVRGDSGNTLIQKIGNKTVLVGLAASYSPHISNNDKPIFTQVSLYVDWIKKKTSGAFSLTYGYLVLIATAISVTKNLFY